MLKKIPNGYYYVSYFALNIWAVCLMKRDSPYLETIIRLLTAIPLVLIIVKYGKINDLKIQISSLLLVSVAIAQSIAVWNFNYLGIVISGFLLIVVKIFTLEFYRKELEAVKPDKFWHLFIFLIPLVGGFMYATLYLEPKLSDEYLFVTMLVIFIDSLFFSLALYYCLVAKSLSLYLLALISCVVISDLLVGLFIVKDSFAKSLFYTYILNIFSRLFFLHSLILDILKKDIASLKFIVSKPS